MNVLATVHQTHSTQPHDRCLSVCWCLSVCLFAALSHTDKSVVILADAVPDLITSQWGEIKMEIYNASHPHSIVGHTLLGTRTVGCLHAVCV